jgi:hypothetical protein
MLIKSRNGVQIEFQFPPHKDKPLLEDTPTSENQGHDEQNQENHKYNLGDAGGCTCNTGEPKYRSNDGDNE